MTRGFSMVVDEDKSQVKPTGVGSGLIRTFSTDIPSYDNTQQINAGKSLQNVAEDLMRVSGTEAAEKAAKEVQIAQDENGNYVRPESPWMGVALRGQYNKIVDQTFVNTVYRDGEAELDRIATSNFHDPRAAGTLMNEAVQARLGKVEDPALRNQLGVIFGREVNERQRGILSYRAKADFQNTVEFSKAEQATEMERGDSAYTIGDMARGDEHYARARSAVEMRGAMGVDHEGMAGLFDETQKQAKSNATVVRIFEDLARKESLTPQDFDTVRVMLRGGGDDRTNWNGLTKERLFNAIPDPQMRDRLATRLRAIETDFFQKQAAKAAAVEPKDYLQSFANRGGRPLHWSPVEDAARTMAWLSDGAANGAGKPLDPLSGATVQHLWAKRGDLPAALYEKAFEGAASEGPGKLVKLAETWNALQHLPVPGGDTAPMPKGIVRDEDAAFMTVFARQYAGATGKTEDERAATAAKEARTIIKTGEDTVAKVTDLGDFVAKHMTSSTGRPMSSRDAEKKILAAVSDADKLSGEQKRMLVTSAATLVAKGMSVVDATSQAAERFKQTHVNDATQGGWVHKDLAVPPIQDVWHPGKHTTEWAWAYVNAIVNANADLSFDRIDGKVGSKKVIVKEGQGDPTTGMMVSPAEVRDEPVMGRVLKDPLIPRDQFSNFTLPDKLGPDNIVLKNTGTTQGGDPQFAVLYKTPDGQVLPLRDKNFNEVTLRFGKAHDAQAKEAADILANRKQPGLFEGAAPARVNPKDVWDPATVKERGERDTTPDTPPRAARGQPPRPLPFRDDGMPSPFEDVPHAKISAAPIDVYQFSSMGRNGRARLSVTNDSGPRAGQEITVRPELVTGISAMVQAMPEEVRAGFRVGSTVRSYEEQVDIARDTMRKRGSQWNLWAATPGHSKHEVGQAADLQMEPVTQAWVHRNAERFGLHFPMSHEPWHIEPIGSRGRRAEGDSEWMEG